MSGFVKESGTQESLTGVLVKLSGSGKSCITNSKGYFSMPVLAKDSIQLDFSSRGYYLKKEKLSGLQDTLLVVFMKTLTDTISEIVALGELGGSNNAIPMSTVLLDIKQIQNIPALLGEKDMLKILQMLPGVQKGREGSSGLYVRGGGPEQNLILLDDAMIYNAFHLFGFYSLFNGDAIKSIRLTKGGFPARFGGRLSSVVELNMKEGNKQRMQGQAGIGMISSGGYVEGPIVKNKSSFLVSARRTYLDILSKPFMSEKNNLYYYFYDFNTKLHFDINSRNKIYISSYFGQDLFKSKDTHQKSVWQGNMSWGNKMASARWTHLFGNKYLLNTTLLYSKYKLKGAEINTYPDGWTEASFNSLIQDISIKSDLSFNFSSSHMLNAGLILISHRYNPGATMYKQSYGAGSNSSTNDPTESLEGGIYFEDSFRPLTRWTMNAGVRVSYYRQKERTYINPEPRISTVFRVTELLSMKASYAIMNQYIHLLTYTKVGLPVDLWVPATDKTRPQNSSQVALGFSRDFNNPDFYISVESYYKRNKHTLAYRSGAGFLDLNQDISEQWEDKITSGQSWSYGNELLLHKRSGKVSGWVGYTLSWTYFRFDSLNGGKKFFAPYDRRHDASVVIIYKPSTKITLSATWVYSSGNRITLPEGKYNGRDRDKYFPSAYITYFTDKNGFRMPDFHRMDVGIQFHKRGKKERERTWEISVYNLYNRLNPYFYFIRSSGTEQQKSTQTKLMEVVLFPVLPSISYRVKF